MAPNSLFAILLRSPWWISIGIAVLFFAVSHALLSPELRLFGAAGGLPFLGIGIVACWRQWRAPSPRRIEQVTLSLAAMSWPDFARVLEEGFRRQGFAVERVQGAADMRLQRRGQDTLVSARRWKAARHGEEALQSLQQQARSQDAVASAYVALGELTPQALRFAQEHRVQVLQAPELAQLLRGVSLPSP
ncbi:restriction endonuclease [Ramlibacter sp. AW1]|uniref:Restriction endonuclease n=2 Tax=Ramlibacter aurantiacus TaxID=2801330 RepID=A0A936ZQA8_9BURK|nr:restriction endonuclease [Ramlibacter aurantiacus]